jgi:hypothetical protein
LCNAVCKKEEDKKVDPNMMPIFPNAIQRATKINGRRETRR